MKNLRQDTAGQMNYLLRGGFLSSGAFHKVLRSIYYPVERSLSSLSGCCKAFIDKLTLISISPLLNSSGLSFKSFPIRLLFLSLIISWFSNQATAQTTQTFTTSGTFTVPAGVTSVTVQCWGAGGGGSSINSATTRRGGGGGGGAFASSVVTVTPGNTYNVVVGAGGGAGAAGGNSTFNGATVVAAGGSGGGGGTNNSTAYGAGGTIANSIGTNRNAGGDGATGGSNPNVYSGGGGGGAGTTGPGGNAPTAAAGSFGTGTTLNGGNGGASVSGKSNGNNGNNYGGGGSGASNDGTTGSRTGGSGANGLVIITYTCPTYSLTSISATTPICQGSSSTVTLTSSAAGLPIGTYTVTYNLSGSNTGSGTPTVTVTTAGTGSFTIPAASLANSGTTTVTITNLTSLTCSTNLSTSTNIVVNAGISNNTISSAQSICSGSTPVGLTGTLPTGGTGSYTYLWQSSTTSGTTGFITASGTSNGQNYSPGALTQTTWYRRTVTSGSCGSNTSTALQITVTAAPAPRIEFTQFSNPPDTVYNVTVACGIIVGGGQNDLDIVPPTDPGGTATYQWEESQTPSGPWNHIGLGPTSTQNQFVLDPDYVNYLMVAGDYYFHVIITNNGCSGTSNVAHLHVAYSSNLTGGTIGSDQTFNCGGSVDPAAFTQITAPTGGPGSPYGTYYYQWQYSYDNITFTNITNATGTTYDPPAGVTQTTYYRRYVVSGGCRSFSNSVKVTLNTVPQPGSISGPTTVCPSSTGNTYNIAAVTGATSYTWTVPTGWTITGGTGTNTITVTAGNAGQSGNVTVAVVSSCGTSSPSTLAVNLSTPVSLTVSPGAVVEGCTGQITLSRDPSYVTQAVTVNLTYTGTAINGTDITPALPSSVTFLAGESTKSISFLAVADGITEGSEVLNIQLSQLCACSGPGCSAQTITIYDPLTITATAVNVVCNSVNSGTITVNPTFGSPNITFSIDGGVNWQASNLFTGLAPGTYTIWAKDAGSCVDHITTTATVGTPINITANAGPSFTICNGSSVELQGSGGATYSWTPVTGLSDPTIPNPVASPTVTTTYTLVVKDATGQCTSTNLAQTTVTVNPIPSALITTVPSNGQICSGNSITLTASGGATYLWNVAPPLTTASIIESPSSNTSYTVIVTSADGCTSNATANVVVHPLPTAVLSGNADICIGNTATLTFTLTGTAPWTIVYTDGTTQYTIPSNTYNYEIQVNPVSTTAYSLVSVTDATGCGGTVSGSANVTVTPIPTNPANPPPTCFGWGDFVTISIDPIPGVTYLWQESPDNGVTWNDLIYNVWYQYWGTRTNSLMVWTPDASKDGYLYRCVVTSSCVQTTASARLTELETPYFDITPIQAIYCLGSTGVTLTAQLTGQDKNPADFTWEWRLNGITIPGATTYFYNATTPGLYSAYATSAMGCSWGHSPSTVLAQGGTVSVSIASNPNPPSICTGTQVVFTATAGYDGTPTPTFQYQWQKNGVPIAGATNSTYTDPGTSNGTITCVVTALADCALNNPATSTGIPITVNPLVPVSVSIAASPGTTICSGTSVTFTATPTNGGTSPSYQWKKNGTNVGTNSATYTDATLINSDQITCILTSNIACPSGNPATSNSLIFNVNSPSKYLMIYSLGLNPRNNVDSTVVYCYSDPGYQLGMSTSQSGVTYHLLLDGVEIASTYIATGGSPFFFGPTSPTYYTLNGKYTVRAELNGCSVNMYGFFTLNSAPTISPQPSNLTVCEGTSASFTVAASGGNLIYQWQKWNGSSYVNVSGAEYSGATSPTLTINPVYAGDAGNYVVVVSNSCKSVTSNPATLTVNTAPAISTQPSNQQICSGTNATFTVSATGTGLSYQWQVNTGSGFNNVTNTGVYSGATTPTLNITGATAVMNGYIYQCIITGTCSPSATSNSVTLTVNPLPVLSGSSTGCPGKTTQWTATGTPALVSPWVSNNTNVATVDNNGLITGVAAGTADITFTDINGCSKTMTIGIGAIVTITSQPQNKTGCYGSNVTFSVSYSYSGQVNYNWYRVGTTGPILSGSTSSSPIHLTLNNIGANGNDVDQSQYRVEIGPSSIGCMISSGTATLTVNPLPVCSITGGVDAVCAGSTTTWSASAGMSSYSWTGPGGFTAITKDITIGNAGTYTVTITDANGCQSTCSRTLTVYPLPATSPIYHQ